MADPHWTSYVGMATGIVGAITGISGAVLGYISYRKSNDIKSLDLRIELKRAISNFKSELDKTIELLPYVNNSRFRVASATGNLHSGAMVQWKENYEKDTVELKNIETEASDFDNTLDSLLPIDLENEIIRVHNIQVKLNEIAQKYKKELEVDDKERERIRDRHEPK